MTPDSDPSGETRRRKGKPTTIDLTATDVAAAADAAQSEPASGPAPAPDGEPATPDAPAPTVTVDTVAADTLGDAAAVAAATHAEPAADEALRPAGDGATPSSAEAPAADGAASAEPPTSDITGERFTPPAAAPAAPSGPAGADARGGSSGLALVAAALVGGLIGLAGSALLVSNGVVRPPEAPAAVTPDMVGAVDARVSDLDQRIARVETAPPPAPDAGLTDRIGKLEQTVSGLPAPDPALAQRLADVEAAVKTLPATGDAPSASDLSAVRSAVSALAARVDALPAPSADPAPAIADLQAAVEALKSSAADSKATLDRLAAAPAPVDPARVAALETGIQDLSAKVAALESGVAGLKQALGDEVGGVRSALDGGLSDLRRALGDEIAAVKSAQGEAASAAGSLGERVADIEKRLDAGPKGGEIAALSLAVTTLSSRIAEGAPFAADLAVVEKTAPDLAEVAALKPIADTGVATIDALAEQLPVAAIMAARPVTDDSGVLDRVLSGAKSLVNYRETGPGTEDPASKAIDAIRAALASGDSRAARQAAEGLPDWAKAAAADWLGRLDARATADAALEALTTRMLDRLKAPAEGR